MNVIIQPSALRGTIPAIASKSAAHRLLICAAFADAPTKIALNASSEDIEATARCLAALGARVERVEDGLVVSPAAAVPSGSRLDCGESGSTLRFLLPVAAAVADSVSFVGTGRLAERPLSPLYEELSAHGVAMSEQGVFPLRLQGRLEGGSFALAGNVSSQFATGLLLAAPLMAGETRIAIAEPVESLPYIELTIAAMKRFGVEVRSERADGVLVLSVAADAAYRSPGEIACEGDWSNAAIWLAAGALSADGVTVGGLELASVQGDRAILGALALMGARIGRMGHRAHVERDALRAATIDISATPDLAPALALVASLAEGETRITGAARLRLKESDRLETVRSALNALGAEVDIAADSLVIHGVHALAGGVVDAARDHRIAMMAAVAGAFAQGPVTIRGAECVAKSYPAFFDDFAQLGGIVRKEC